MSKNKESNNSDSGQSTPSSHHKELRQLAPYLNIPYTFLGSMLLMYWLGTWLDARWDTGSYMSLIGILLGLAAGFYHLFKVVLKSPGNRSINK